MSNTDRKKQPTNDELDNEMAGLLSDDDTENQPVSKDKKSVEKKKEIAGSSAHVYSDGKVTGIIDKEEITGKLEEDESESEAKMRLRYKPKVVPELTEKQKKELSVSREADRKKYIKQCESILNNLEHTIWGQMTEDQTHTAEVGKIGMGNLREFLLSLLSSSRRWPGKDAADNHEHESYPELSQRLGLSRVPARLFSNLSKDIRNKYQLVFELYDLLREKGASSSSMNLGQRIQLFLNKAWKNPPVRALFFKSFVKTGDDKQVVQGEDRIRAIEADLIRQCSDYIASIQTPAKRDDAVKKPYILQKMLGHQGNYERVPNEDPYMGLIRFYKIILTASPTSDIRALFIKEEEEVNCSSDAIKGLMKEIKRLENDYGIKRTDDLAPRDSDDHKQKYARQRLLHLWKTVVQVRTETLSNKEIVDHIRSLKKEMVSTGQYFESRAGKNTGAGLFGVTGQQNLEKLAKSLEKEYLPQQKQQPK